MNLGVILLKLQIAVLMLTSASLSHNPVEMNNATVYSNNILAEAVQYLNVKSPAPVVPEPTTGGTVPEVAPIPEPVVASCTVSYETRDMTGAEIKLNKDMWGSVSANPKITRVDWTLNNLPITTKGKLYSKNGNGWIESGSLINQDVGPFPNQNSTNIPYSFPYGIKADFNGTICYANATSN